MNPLFLELIPYIKEGYACSQLLVILAMQMKGEENPGLLRAMGGMCRGMGQSGGPCGLLGGGVSALAWLSGTDDSRQNPMLDAMINEYATWFQERTEGYGSYECQSVVAGLSKEQGVAVPEDGKPELNLCADLLAECWDKILEIYDNYHLDQVGE